MPILDPEKLPTAASLGERFTTALEQVQDKLLHLVANIPLLLIALLIVLVASWLGGVVSRRMRVVKRLSSSNPYMEGLLRNTVRIVITLFGVVVALDLLNATSLVGAVLGSAGVIGLVLGFGFKDIAENYIAGVLLSLRKPFSPGNSVRIDSYDGKVVALTARATILMTADGNHLQLPNSVVFKSVMLNYSRNPKRRFDFDTSVDNQASWHDAMDAGIAAIIAVEGVLTDPPPNALIRTLSNDGATLHYSAWIDQSHNDLARTRSEAMRQVRNALRKAGMMPPESVQKVILMRSDVVAEPAMHESYQARDTSVDRTLDAQVGNAQQLEDGGDMLRPQPPQTPEP